jgi:hypothetical protein
MKDEDATWVQEYTWPYSTPMAWCGEFRTRVEVEGEEE